MSAHPRQNLLVSSLRGLIWLVEFLLLLLLFERGSHCVAEAGFELELTM
jgi:hypothetical protein